METSKIYVDVNARFSKDGRLIPMSFIWKDGHTYEIQRIKDVRRVGRHNKLRNQSRLFGGLRGFLNHLPDIGDEGLLHLRVEVDLRFLNEDQQAQRPAVGRRKALLPNRGEGLLRIVIR